MLLFIQNSQLRNCFKRYVVGIDMCIEITVVFFFFLSDRQLTSAACSKKKSHLTSLVTDVCRAASSLIAVA